MLPQRMHSPLKSRVHFIDWMRGVAATIMLQGHTFDAFTRPEDRNGAFFTFSQFIGGEAAALFLLVTGITYGMGMNKRQNLSWPSRIIEPLKRSRFLFLLAIAFRMQNWIFAWGRSPWQDMLRVDILNIMGATAALISFLAQIGRAHV